MIVLWFSNNLQYVTFSIPHVKKREHDISRHRGVRSIIMSLPAYPNHGIGSPERMQRCTPVLMQIKM